MIGEAKRIKNYKLTNEYQIYVFEITSSENIILNRMLLQLVTDASEVIMSVKDIQLEKGLTESKYVEHQSQTKALYTQQPFRAIKDVKDRFIKKDGVWHEEHSIHRRIFDGTEEWAFVKTNENISLYQVLLSNVNYYSGSSKELLCNMFYSYSSGGLWGLPSEGICINSIKNLQIATADIINSVENWKAKLQQLYNAGTPLYVDYLLAEPLIIPCTSEQVEVLESFNTYEGTTNISADSIGELEVTYFRNKKPIVNNRGNTTAKPIFTIYGEGDIQMYLNGNQAFNIALGTEEHITIDIDKMEAYKDSTSVLKNRLVTGNYDNFILKSGENVIEFFGKVSAFEISNYSRWI
jgi:hypothetical protein